MSTNGRFAFKERMLTAVGTRYGGRNGQWQ